MALFKKKKTTKRNTRKISKLNSPYRKLLTPPKRKIRHKKRRKRVSAILLPKKRKSTKSNKGKIVLAIILSVGIISYGIYAIFFSNFFIIESYSIEEEGVFIEDNESLNNIVQRTLGKNLVLLNETEIKSEIKKINPEINKINIIKIFPRSIKIEYEKYPTVANLVNIVDIVQKKFLVDNQGFLVEEDIEEPNLPHIYYKTDKFLKVRNNFLNNKKRSKKRLTQIIQSIDLFEEKFAMKILFAKYKQKEREVHLETEKHFYIIIDLEKDINRQLEKLKKALPKLDIYNENLVYIDLRISGTNTGKVIYKRR